MRNNASNNKNKQYVSWHETDEKLNCAKLIFEIQISNYDYDPKDPKDINCRWPRGIEELEITSITFIPYENVRYGESTPSPKLTSTPVDFN